MLQQTFTSALLGFFSTSHFMIYLTIFFDVVVTDVFDAVARPDLISILARPKTGYSLSTELEKKSQIAEELLYFLW